MPACETYETFEHSARAECRKRFFFGFVIRAGGRVDLMGLIMVNIYVVVYVMHVPLLLSIPEITNMSRIRF